MESEIKELRKLREQDKKQTNNWNSKAEKKIDKLSAEIEKLRAQSKAHELTRQISNLQDLSERLESEIDEVWDNLEELRTAHDTKALWKEIEGIKKKVPTREVVNKITKLEKKVSKIDAKPPSPGMKKIQELEKKLMRALKEGRMGE